MIKRQTVKRLNAQDQISKVKRSKVQKVKIQKIELPNGKKEGKHIKGREVNMSKYQTVKR